MPSKRPQSGSDGAPPPLQRTISSAPLETNNAATEDARDILLQVAAVFNRVLGHGSAVAAQMGDPYHGAAAVVDESAPHLGGGYHESRSVRPRHCWSNCAQCHRCHDPDQRCRCYACGQLHHSGLPCAMSMIAALQCAVCHQSHPPGPCIAATGPIPAYCNQCGRCHLPSVRCKCRICGLSHSALSPCAAVRASNSHDAFAGAAFSRLPVPAYDAGAFSETCPHCGALLFCGESRYLSCCHKGTITQALPDVPPALYDLITESHVHLHIREYNTALAMASVGYSGQAMGGRPHVDGYGSLKISGRVYHRIGSMLPNDGQSPVWGQLYMLDAADATSLRMVNANCARRLRPCILQQLHALLQQHNPWIREFVAASTEESMALTWSSDDVSARAGMVAVRASAGPRSIIVQRQSTGLIEISDRHPLYFPLAYVLLWPVGGVGYSEAMTRRDPQTAAVIGKLHELEWARYMIMRRREASLIHSCGKLSLEFMCDVWSSIECRNLSYLSTSTMQSQFRSSRFCAVMDQLHTDKSNMHKIGAPMLLPATFTGSPRWYHALFLDALALPSAYHLPDLFVTITCNPEWPEFARVIPVGSSIYDHPDVVARVFWLRFSRIMKDIVDFAVCGEVVSYCYRIEWQLRGLPHAHLLLILRNRIDNVEVVDRMVSAEIPDPNSEPELHRLVLQFMIHGPCNHGNAPCVEDGVCNKNFPKQLQSSTVMMPNAYPFYKRRGLYSAQVRGQQVTDAWVVPYSPYLLHRHRAHINGKI